MTIPSADLTALRGVIHEIEAAVEASTQDSKLHDADLRRVLSFLAKVAHVVDQAFQDVYALAIDAAHLKEADLSSERLSGLLRDLDLVLATSHYRDAEEICSRLKHLRMQYESQVRPLIEHLPEQADWKGLFWLIEEREGRIVRLIEQTTGQLREDLHRLDAVGLPAFRDSTRSLIAEMRPLLIELRDITNGIMGFSGKPGFLELTNSSTAPTSFPPIVLHQGPIDMSKSHTTHNEGIIVSGGSITATNVAVGKKARIVDKHVKATLAPPEEIASDKEIAEVAAAAGRKTGDLQEWAGSDRGTLAIVFTDIVDSTAIGQELKDEAFRTIRLGHFERSRELIAKHGGKEIKTIGDSFMTVFKSTAPALDYALALQAETGHPRVRIRAGIHVGSIDIEDDDIFGGEVNFAARVMGKISGAEIWLSDRAKKDLEVAGTKRHIGLEWEPHEGVAMKGFEEGFVLWSLRQRQA